MSKQTEIIESPLAYDPKWTVSDLNLVKMFGLDKSAGAADRGAGNEDIDD
jgi:hypothetical protein